MLQQGLKMREILCIIIFLLLCGCGQKPSDTDIVSTNSLDSIQKLDPKKLNKMMYSILNDGDTISYKAYKDYMFSGDYVEDFLFWPLVMANKFDYPPAHLDVFNCILESYVCGDLNRINEIDP